jgi:hypothetical protein
MSLRPSPAARRRQRAKHAEPGRAEWKAPHSGRCEGCGRRGPLVRHHVVREQDVRSEGGDPWDQRNAMELGRYCNCHGDHHAPNGQRKLPLEKVPQTAIRFTVELMGEDRAVNYLSRHYSGG